MRPPPLPPATGVGLGEPRLDPDIDGLPEKLARLAVHRLPSLELHHGHLHRIADELVCQHPRLPPLSMNSPDPRAPEADARHFGGVAADRYPTLGTAGQEAWLTELMLKSGTRTGGISHDWK